MLDDKWKQVLRSWRQSERAKKLLEVLKQGNALPEANRLRALEVTPFDSVRVVILGQDPYHTPGMATGLAFEVDPSIPKKAWPPSYRNIVTEMRTDVGSEHPLGTHHAQQGVLLLNSFLSVAPGKPMSHAFLWDGFADAVIKGLTKKENIVWLAWGQAAQGTLARLRKYSKTHVVVNSPHPSPLAGLEGGPTFVGSKPFSRCNKVLTNWGFDPINW